MRPSLSLALLMHSVSTILVKHPLDGRSLEGHPKELYRRWVPPQEITIIDPLANHYEEQRQKKIKVHPDPARPPHRRHLNHRDVIDQRLDL